MTEIENKSAPARRMQIITRVTPAMYEALNGIAADAGRSLAQEVEMRVARTLRDDEERRNRPPMSESPGLTILIRYISRAFSFMEQLSGEAWHDDDAANAVMQDLMIEMVVHCFQAQSVTSLSEEDRKRVAQMIEAKEHVIDMMLWRKGHPNVIWPDRKPEPEVPTAVSEHRKHMEAKAAKEAGPQPEPTPRRRAPRLSKLAKADPAARPATPDEIAGMVSARGQLPPEIGDRAAFDDAVAGLPLVKAEKATEAKHGRKRVMPPDDDVPSPAPAEPQATPKRRRIKVTA